MSRTATIITATSIAAVGLAIYFFVFVKRKKANARQNDEKNSREKLDNSPNDIATSGLKPQPEVPENISIKDNKTTAALESENQDQALRDDISSTKSCSLKSSDLSESINSIVESDVTEDCSGDVAALSASKSEAVVSQEPQHSEISNKPDVSGGNAALSYASVVAGILKPEHPVSDQLGADEDKQQLKHLSNQLMQPFVSDVVTDEALLNGNEIVESFASMKDSDILSNVVLNSLEPPKVDIVQTVADLYQFISPATDAAEHNIQGSVDGASNSSNESFATPVESTNNSTEQETGTVSIESIESSTMTDSTFTLPVSELDYEFYTSKADIKEESSGGLIDEKRDPNLLVTATVVDSIVEDLIQTSVDSSEDASFSSGELNATWVNSGDESPGMVEPIEPRKTGKKTVSLWIQDGEPEEIKSEISSSNLEHHFPSEERNESA